MVPLRLTRHDEHADEITDPAIGQSLYVQIHLRSRECEHWITEQMHLFLAERERLERKVVVELLLLPLRRSSRAESVGKLFD